MGPVLLHQILISAGALPASQADEEQPHVDEAHHPSVIRVIAFTRVAKVLLVLA